MGMFDTPAESSPVDLDFESQEQIGYEEESGADDQQQEMQQEEVQEEETQVDEEQELPPDEQDTEEEPELILGKYKSQDDLIKAHQELQKRFGEMRNEVGQLRQMNSQPQPQNPQMTQEQYYEANQQFWDNFQRDPFGTLANTMQTMIQSQVQPMLQPVQQMQFERQIDNEINALSSHVDEQGQTPWADAKELAPLIKQVINENPNLFMNAENPVGYAYAIAKGHAAQLAVQQARTQGVKEGRKNAALKGAGKMPGKKAKQTQEPRVSPEEQIVNDIFAHRKGGFFG